MARQTSQIEMIGGKGPRQRVWDAIRSIAAKKQAFTQNDIERTAKVEGSAIKDYFKVLLKAGFITVSDTEQVKGICIRYSYHLARDNGIEAPRIDKSGKIIKEGTSNERMWQTMRRMFIGKDFNYRELAFHATTPSSVCSETNAKAYVLALHKAGYLECVTPSKAGNGAKPARFALIKKMDTGPRAPMIQRTKTVFDANLGKVIWQEPAGEQDE